MDECGLVEGVIPTYGDVSTSNENRRQEGMRDLNLLAPTNRWSNSDFSRLIDELPVGMNPSSDEVALWKADFEGTRTVSGYRIVGFRRTSDGLVIAIIARYH